MIISHSWRWHLNPVVIMILEKIRKNAIRHAWDRVTRKVPLTYASILNVIEAIVMLFAVFTKSKNELRANLYDFMVCGYYSFVSADKLLRSREPDRTATYLWPLWISYVPSRYLRQNGVQSSPVNARRLDEVLRQNLNVICCFGQFFVSHIRTQICELIIEVGALIKPTV